MDHLNKLTPALIMLAAAIIFTGGLVWFGLRSPQGPAGAPLPTPITSSSTPQQQGPVAGVPIFHNPVVGTVTSVGQNSITIAASASSGLGAPASTSTIPTVVTINSNTEIYKQGALKSQTELQQEIAAFQAKVSGAGRGIVYQAPDQYTHVALTLSDVHIGNIIVVIPTADQNAPGDAVTAQSIQVLIPPAQ